MSVFLMLLTGMKIIACYFNNLFFSKLCFV